MTYGDTRSRASSPLRGRSGTAQLRSGDFADVACRANRAGTHHPRMSGSAGWPGESASPRSPSRAGEPLMKPRSPAVTPRPSTPTSPMIRRLRSDGLGDALPGVVPAVHAARSVREELAEPTTSSGKDAISRVPRADISKGMAPDRARWPGLTRVIRVRAWADVHGRVACLRQGSSGEGGATPRSPGWGMPRAR